MSHPLVVNRRRTSNWDVYVGRPSEWGNPFVVGVHGQRGECIEKYIEWLHKHPEIIEAAQEQLRGKVLACWCAPEPCHADILAQVANS